ncbi:hypothetical protein BH10PLA2_BH10PLA2_03470 [soil metagenome]
MLIIHNSAAMAHSLDGPADTMLKHLLTERSAQLAEYGTDLGELACFIVVQPGDLLPDIEAAMGFPITANFIDGVPYGEEGFMPSWEWIQDHGGWFEVIFILEDGGFGHVLFVQDTEGVDPQLLSLCREHASIPNDQGPPN